MERVDTPAGRFVLRRRHAPVDRPGSVAIMELRSQQTAAAAGLAPALIAAAPDGQWLLMEFVEGSLWTEAQLLSPHGLSVVGARLDRLHALTAPAGLPRLDAPAIAIGYVQQLQELQAVDMDSWHLQQQQVEVLSRALSGLADQCVLNHGDLQCANLIGDQPMLIDWEYAQLADPTYDIACLLTYYPQAEPHLDVLLASAGMGNPAQRRILALQRERFACLNRLWAAVDAAKAG